MNPAAFPAAIPSSSTPSYSLVRWPFGWTLNSTDGRGIPLSALNEIGPLLSKKSVMHFGIAHHLRLCADPNVIECITDEPARWIAQIETSIAGLPPEERWLKGLDVGASSSSMFAVLCHGRHLKQEAERLGRRSVPRDADDLGRCLRLIELFPAWEHRLEEVADAYSDTAWKEIVADWPQLKSSSTSVQDDLLRKAGESSDRRRKEWLVSQGGQR